MTLFRRRPSSPFFKDNTPLPHIPSASSAPWNACPSPNPRRQPPPLHVVGAPVSSPFGAADAFHPCGIRVVFIDPHLPCPVSESNQLFPPLLLRPPGPPSWLGLGYWSLMAAPHERQLVGDADGHLRSPREPHGGLLARSHSATGSPDKQKIIRRAIYSLIPFHQHIMRQRRADACFLSHRSGRLGVRGGSCGATSTTKATGWAWRPPCGRRASRAAIRPDPSAWGGGSG